jgi:hypothetical protein
VPRHFGPARRHRHLDRVGRRGQDLSQQGIGIERNRRDKLLELLLTKRLLLLLRRLLRRVLGLLDLGP